MIEHGESVFDCKMCGHCCEGSGGIILSPSDLARLSTHLGMEADAVSQHYAERVNGKLKIRNGDDGRCIFFREGRGCGVHAAKPSVCRAWPFFRGNIEDPSSLALAKEYCPGIRPDASHAEFAREGLDTLRREGLLAQDASCEANALILR